jgi:hypothetical protein
MNREIKFRGLRTDGKGWVYGDLMTNGSITHISNFDNGVNREQHEVKPETVGQYVKNVFVNGVSVDLFEGDIETYDVEDGIATAVIEACETDGETYGNMVFGFRSRLLSLKHHEDGDEEVGYSITGNIHTP